MNPTVLPPSRTKRDPLTALLSPDKRLRQDLQKAVRHVAEKLERQQLRSFLDELSALLAKWNNNAAAREPATS